MLSLKDRLEDSVQNLTNLTLVAECYRDLANRTLKTWMESDSLRVDELQELLDRLPEKHQRAIRKEDCTLIPSKLCPEKCALGDLYPQSRQKKCWKLTPLSAVCTHYSTRRSLREFSSTRGPAVPISRVPSRQNKVESYDN